MPIPRLTRFPARSSSATRFAMMVCGSMVSPVGNHVIDKRCRRHDVIRCDYPDWNDMLGGDDDSVSRHRHHRIEVSRGQGVREIAEIVGEEGMYQRELRAQRGLEQE